MEDHDKYLGLPMSIGRSKKAVFQVIQDRVWKKVKGWKERMLSQAGREVMIKAVVQAIPTYVMQCFAIPVDILKQEERISWNFFWGSKEKEKKIAWIAWEKLCEPKSNGGLGMRDMVAFNKALLAKQCWRIMTSPNSLMVRILKKKYFPNCDFMSASNSSPSSYTWRSILAARDILKRGVRWVVGNGESIDIWKDPWVPTVPGFKVQPQHSDNDKPQLVSELIDQNGPKWREEVIEEYFNPQDAREIWKIPIPQHDNADILRWHYTKNGLFSVRSAYHVVKQEDYDMGSCSNGNASRFWHVIWKLQLPQKIKNFAWRVLHNSLAVGSNLKRRGINHDPMCSQCGENEEDVDHTLRKCSLAQTIWYSSPLRLQFSVEFHSFKEWFLFLLSKRYAMEWWSLF